MTKISLILNHRYLQTGQGVSLFCPVSVCLVLSERGVVEFQCPHID